MRSANECTASATRAWLPPSTPRKPLMVASARLPPTLTTPTESTHLSQAVQAVLLSLNGVLSFDLEFALEVTELHPKKRSAYQRSDNDQAANEHHHDTSPLG